MKVSLPLIEVVKLTDYKNETIKILSKVGEVNKEDHKPKFEDPPVVYLETSITSILPRLIPFI